MHYQRWKKTGDPGPAGRYTTPDTCTVDGCDQTHYARGYCTSHHYRWRKHGNPEAPLLEYPDTCTIDGCGQAHYGKGLCEMHYARQRRRGNVGRPEREVVERGLPLDWLRSLPDTDECIEWPFTRLPTGYGKVKFDGSARYAHHVALVLAGKGERPDGMEACHACDNPPCVNPRHLRWDTHAENIADKKRPRLQRGASHSVA